MASPELGATVAPCKALLTATWVSLEKGIRGGALQASGVGCLIEAMLEEAPLSEVVGCIDACVERRLSGWGGRRKGTGMRFG